MTYSSRFPSRWISLIPVFGIFFLAIVLRLIHWAAEPMIARDGIYYLQQGKLLFDQSNVYIPSPPLYEILISWGRNIPQIPLQLWAQLISMIAGAAVPLAGYFGCKKFFQNPSDPIGVGVFLAIFPPFVAYSHQVLQESLFSFFVVAGIACVMRGLYPQCHWKWFCGGAFFAAGATFTQWGGLILPITISAFLFAGFLLSASQRKAYILAIAGFGASFAIWVLLLLTFCPYPYQELLFLLRKILC